MSRKTIDEQIAEKEKELAALKEKKEKTLMPAQVPIEGETVWTLFNYENGPLITTYLPEQHRHMWEMGLLSSSKEEVENNMKLYAAITKVRRVLATYGVEPRIPALYYDDEEAYSPAFNMTDGSLDTFRINESADLSIPLFLCVQAGAHYEAEEIFETIEEELRIIFGVLPEKEMSRVTKEYYEKHHKDDEPNYHQ